jgi:CheY-specific phosphatase CheX
MSSALDFAGTMPDLQAAFEEVARTALGLPEVTVGAPAPTPYPPYQGAYLGLMGVQGALQIGLASTEEGCQALAKRLMGMADGDPPLEPAEMADAVCEIVNIVAGAFKGKVRERMGNLTMGLPVFFRGPAQPTGHTAVKVTLASAGTLTAALIIVFPRTETEG